MSGLNTEYHERVIEFSYKASAAIRKAQYDLSVAITNLNAATDPEEIARLEGLKAEAESQLLVTIANNKTVQYTIGVYSSEDAYLRGGQPVTLRSFDSEIKPEHQEIYGQLAAILYADAVTKIPNLVEE